MLTGKQLLLEELPFSMEELQKHNENGYILYRKGINRVPLSCTRCGTSDPTWFAEFPCSRCGKVEFYCRSCLMMGRVSECTPLVSWAGPNLEFNRISEPLHWDGQLSAGQKAASRRVMEAVEKSAELLVWAVAGAGKTEVLFAGIAQALSTGRRVCVATPRTDVVLELAPRFEKVFPDIKIAALYGGSEDRHEYAQLTIATTHQLLRFYKAFDVMIVDEVDAFPYSIDETLQYAARQSRKSQSSLIYLTATPKKQWQKECRLGKRNYVTIPARFHRHPLPIPQFVWSGNWEKQLSKRRLSTPIKKWIESRLASGKQAMIFAPKIIAMDKTLLILRQLHPLIESVHAEDPDREEKVMKFRNKEIPILLTTTILERGVTISNIDVAVIGSEDRIFTESALVQIAGRAGRSAEYPTGNVTFFHYGKTEAMFSARSQIVMMNKDGIKRGLIDV
ncbi:DEAD/DEAH box helicase [Bacillus sp. ISL-45]|uniref:DEAD/DEAH box helicase n=1 Tax=Bacillus sp. ISL-45 TaxID=2819128 RepID=UPI001BED0396|nr:DEAD/DEAH box helicase [Bacillus sp. ISL-45]MBT2661791.1 DEAD/DEAH box helicase [Bacillus sp. ISL-45]